MCSAANIRTVTDTDLSPTQSIEVAPRLGTVSRSKTTVNAEMQKRIALERIVIIHPRSGKANQHTGVVDDLPDSRNCPVLLSSRSCSSWPLAFRLSRTSQWVQLDSPVVTLVRRNRVSHGPSHGRCCYTSVMLEKRSRRDNRLDCKGRVHD
jgi:hypothetical protein